MEVTMEVTKEVTWGLSSTKYLSESCPNHVGLGKTLRVFYR
jgi:hypothetical protein